MRLLVVITYYRPYTSGLTIYAERLAKALSVRGHEVTVLCMQHDQALPQKETLDGIEVIRIPYLFRLSKGFIAPKFFVQAARLMRSHQIVHMHLPQFEAGIVATVARLLRRPVVITYHCDLLMPPGALSRFAQIAVRSMNFIGGLASTKIVAYTHDFLQSSKFLTRFKGKCEVVYPPVSMPPTNGEAAERVRRLANINGCTPIVGIAARLASEKGVEVLIDAIKILKERFPKIRVLFAGQWENVVGEDSYREMILPRIASLQQDGNWSFLGILTPAEMGAFYSLLNVLVVPSLNSTESFGLVQIEAMLHGVPSIASNLPGVRQPVQITGAGRVVPIGDAKALAEAISELVSTSDIEIDRDEILKLFSPDATAASYEAIFSSVLRKN